MEFDYLIIGGGMVAAGAATAIREGAPEATIGILSADIDPPYTRPALSKKLWTDPEFGEDKVPLDIDEAKADLRLGTEVVALDADAKKVRTREGEEFGYGRLLLATGGNPKRLPGLEPGDRVSYFRSFADYEQVRSLADRKLSFAVIGGGYIGAEMAAALVQNDCGVALVTSDEVLGGSVFPAGLAARFEKLFTDAGVRVVQGAKVAEGRADDDGVALDLEDGTVVEADAVVVGLGVTPAVGIAEVGGIEVDDGIVVDDRLRTSVADVFAAGDVASYPDAILGRRRVEHVDSANQQGPFVGRVMTGSDETYTHTPYYYSAVFGHRYEAVGTVDSSLDTVEVWSDDLERGVVYYLDGDRVAGVLLWGISDDDSPEPRDAARAVLRDQPGRDELISRIAVD